MIHMLWPQLKESEVGMEERLEGPLYEKAPFKLEDPALHEYVLWLYQNGADTERVAKVMLAIHGNQWVQSHLSAKIAKGYHGMTTIEDLEHEIDRILMYVSGTIEGSFGLEDILSLGTFVNPKNAVAKTLAKATSKEVAGLAAELKLTDVSLKPETWLWGRRLKARIQAYGVTVDRSYVAERMLHYDRLAGKIGKLPRTRIRGNKGYRGVPQGSTHPLRVAHPKSIARPVNRWNLTGDKAVYYGTSKKNTWAEITRSHSRLPPGSVPKVTMKRDWISIENVLDLTDRNTLKALGLDKADLMGKNMALPQVIGSIANELGFEAIIAYSAAAGRRASKNIILLGK